MKKHVAFAFRRWWGWLVLLLALAAGWAIIRWRVGPMLTPVTRRLVPAPPSGDLFYSFAAGGMGLPRLENIYFGTGSVFTRHAWLDDAGRPTRIPRSDDAFPTCLSPRGVLAAGIDGLHATRMPCLFRPHGVKKLDVTFPKDTQVLYYYQFLYHVCMVTDAGECLLGREGDGAVFRRDGTPVDGALFSSITAMDPAYVALTNGSGDLLLYDRTVKRRILKAPSFLQLPPMPTSSVPYPGVSSAYTRIPGVIFTSGTRLLAAPWQGKAVLFENGRRLATLGTTTTGWRWAEDGTVWTVRGQTVQVLRWRSGAPALQTLAIRVRHDARINGFVMPGLYLPQGVGPTDVCLARDGALMAVAETVRLVPERLAFCAEMAGGWVKIHKTIAREGRKLVLYRNGKRLGTFVIRTKLVKSPTPAVPPGGSPYNTLFREHLAFSADGRSLAWLIDAGMGGVQAYGFSVPGK